LEGACQRHVKLVRGQVGSSTYGWLEPGVVPVDQVGDLLEWFYGSSGLSLGPRGISIARSPKPR
jgi:hypothetical protein